jgi:hypothetical protein
LNFATSSKDLFVIFMLCFCPIFWLHDISITLYDKQKNVVMTWSSHGGECEDVFLLGCSAM